jgi:hypothetical protein
MSAQGLFGFDRNSAAMTDFSNKNENQVDHWVANFEKRKETGVTLYYERLEERAKRAQKNRALTLRGLCLLSSSRRDLHHLW